MKKAFLKISQKSQENSHLQLKAKRTFFVYRVITWKLPLINNKVNKHQFRLNFSNKGNFAIFTTEYNNFL